MSKGPLAGQTRVSCPDAGTPRESAIPPSTSYPQSFSSKDLSSYIESHVQSSGVSISDGFDMDAMPEAPNTRPQGSAMNATRPSQRLHADSFGSVYSDDSSCPGDRSQIGQNGWIESWRAFSSSRLLILSLTLLIATPLFYDMPFFGKAGPSTFGASAGVIKRSEVQTKASVDGESIVPRANTNTDVCKRWSQQSAIVNGTIYLYGGRATTDPSQPTGLWNNGFLTIDVTKSWDISSPVTAGLPQPSGPPPVSNGYLWNSFDSLFLYGGEFQDQPNDPAKTPVPYSLWEYSISRASWTEHPKPQSSKGNNSDGGNQPILGAAEGAGVSVPQLGRGYYFGGHQDAYTTPGWSVQVFRLYLKSLLEYTFPGHTNDGVESLSGGKTAGNDGVWRNITSGGIQDTALFPSRADGVLVYVPGYGVSGILVSIGGGNNITFTEQMNVIDVYDIGTSTWYKQSTTGKYPVLRVNPCAVAASAPDGSSTNIYMFGGQNLVPAGNQTQYDDTWILTIPSFTWIEVDTSGQSVPPGRTGHTCNIWDGQMVVVGGYTGPATNGLGCDSGFYVFDATNLTWANNFNALSGSNPQSQQLAQVKDPAALDGSYGYQVPVAVQSVIGGKGTGGATITAPAQKASAGPLATGKAITYTVTGADGATVTETGTASSGGSNGKGSHGPNIAAIVAGVVAGCFAVLAGYLGFCAWVYRRQLKLYKNHVAMTQRAAAAGGEKAAFLGATSSSEGTSAQTKHSTDQSSRKAGSQTGSTPGNSGWGPVPPMPIGAPIGLNSTANSSTEDLIGEPSFVGVLLNPRRSLRVVNRD